MLIKRHVIDKCSGHSGVETLRRRRKRSCLFGRISESSCCPGVSWQLLNTRDAQCQHLTATIHAQLNIKGKMPCCVCQVWRLPGLYVLILMVSRSVQRSPCVSMWKHSRSILYVHYVFILFAKQPYSHKRNDVITAKYSPSGQSKSLRFHSGPNHPVMSLFGQNNRLTGRGENDQSQSRSPRNFTLLNYSAVNNDLQSESHTLAFLKTNNK